MRKASLSLAALVIIACSSTSEPQVSPDGGADASAPPVVGKPPLEGVVTTVERTLVPTKPRQSSQAGPNPSLPETLDGYLGQGFGEVAPGPGEPHTPRTIDGSTPPAPGANAKRIVRFVHIPDFQIADDESPTRLGSFDSPPDGPDAALRPQDPYLCHMANAAVRTINALHKKDPIAFTLLGGDNADSAQTNEVDWVLGILSGADRIKCDSGKDDDLISGPDNDGKDPFKPEGLAMPWKWVTGNHDILVQGNLRIEDKRSDALEARSIGGTRHYEEGKKGEVSREDVIPDPRRALLDRKALMAKLAAHGDGHGIGEAEKQSGRATYTFDVAGTNLRFFVLDTATENGGAEGIIRKAEVDRIIKPTLDKAKADGKWVILSSHHAQSSLSKNGGTFGQEAPDPVLPDEWATFLGGYTNVIFSMVGHTHAHRIRKVAPTGGHAYWEVMTSAIADFPHEFRVVEIFDQDNGWLMLRGTCVDYAVDGDPVAAQGRRLGVVDYQSGWGGAGGLGNKDDRNVELWIKKP